MWSNITDEDIENADDMSDAGMDEVGMMPSPSEDEAEIVPAENADAAFDYAGQKRESNGQFGTGKKNGGNSSESLANHSKSATIRTSKEYGSRELSRESRLNAQAMSKIERRNISEQINTNYHARYRGQRICTFSCVNHVDGEIYDYTFECIDFDTYIFIGKELNKN